MSNQPCKLLISEVRVSPRLQCRVQLETQSLAAFFDALRKGESFPPVVVFRIENELWLADGHHRLESARKAGHSEILAIVHEGTWPEAVRAALAANLKHGVRLTPSDREKAVLLARKEFPDLSDRALGDLCGVSYKTVGRVLKRSVGTMSQLTKVRKGRDGKLYPQRSRAVSRAAKTSAGDSIPAPASNTVQGGDVAPRQSGPLPTASHNSPVPRTGDKDASSIATSVPANPAAAVRKSSASEPTILVRNYVKATIRFYPAALREIEAVLEALLAEIRLKGSHPVPSGGSEAPTEAK